MNRGTVQWRGRPRCHRAGRPETTLSPEGGVGTEPKLTTAAQDDSEAVRLFREPVRLTGLVEFDAQQMRLPVFDRNTPSIRFYKRLGAKLRKKWIRTDLAGPALRRLAR